ncbi:MAG: Uma2 family endonuclease [Candidatus Rokubacteria bacterium]|nr:Uma2 family endonuclease [Candidatus Rokubacteria bacterium]
MTTYEIRTRRWTRAEYGRLIDLGLFQPGEPIELIGGQLMVSEPQGSGHFTTVGLVDDTLRAAFGPGWVVRAQGPLALDDESEPEPDVAVVPGSRRDYLHGHPGLPVLTVEVAESSLSFDRRDKGSLYARAGLGDYWIVNLVDRVLEVYRKPVVDPAAPYGWRYASVTTLRPGDTVSPLAAPPARVPVADLLP